MSDANTQVDLGSLLREIVRAHHAVTRSMKSAVMFAIEAGEGLLRARAALPHGEFGRFCANLPIAQTTARGYMRLARLAPEDRQRVADLPLRRALRWSNRPHDPLDEPATTREIPLGSVGRAHWRGVDGMLRGLEIVPVHPPSEDCVFLHYAMVLIRDIATHDVEVHVTRRPVRCSVEEVAAQCEAPIDELRVFTGLPILWGADGTEDEPIDVKTAWMKSYLCTSAGGVAAVTAVGR